MDTATVYYRYCNTLVTHCVVHSLSIKYSKIYFNTVNTVHSAVIFKF